MEWSIKRPFSPVNKLIYNLKSKYYSTKYPAIEFIPNKLIQAKILVQSPTAWAGLEQIIPAIIEQLDLGTQSCLEFGVDLGYSTGIFAQNFTRVVGVDTFEGDRHAGYRDTLALAKSNLAPFNNVTLIKNNYQNYIKEDHSFYNLCHIDIIHTYEDTYACGEWAIQHAKCVIFHDTESFGSVRRAVFDLSTKYKKKFLNYGYYHGLGILI